MSSSPDIPRRPMTSVAFWSIFLRTVLIMRELVLVSVTEVPQAPIRSLGMKRGCSILPDEMSTCPDMANECSTFFCPTCIQKGLCDTTCGICKPCEPDPDVLTVCADLVGFCETVFCPSCSRPRLCDSTCQFCNEQFSVDTGSPSLEGDCPMSRDVMDTCADFKNYCDAVFCPSCEQAGRCDTTCKFCSNILVPTFSDTLLQPSAQKTEKTTSTTSKLTTTTLEPTATAEPTTMKQTSTAEPSMTTMATAVDCEVAIDVMSVCMDLKDQCLSLFCPTCEKAGYCDLSCEFCRQPPSAPVENSPCEPPPDFSTDCGDHQSQCESMFCLHCPRPHDCDTTCGFCHRSSQSSPMQTTASTNIKTSSATLVTTGTETSTRTTSTRTISKATVMVPSAFSTITYITTTETSTNACESLDRQPMDWCLDVFATGLCETVSCPTCVLKHTCDRTCGFCQPIAACGDVDEDEFVLEITVASDDVSADVPQLLLDIARLLHIDLSCVEVKKNQNSKHVLSDTVVASSSESAPGDIRPATTTFNVVVRWQSEPSGVDLSENMKEVQALSYVTQTSWRWSGQRMDSSPDNEGNHGKNEQTAAETSVEHNAVPQTETQTEMSLKQSATPFSFLSGDITPLAASAGCVAILGVMLLCWLSPYFRYRWLRRVGTVRVEELGNADQCSDRQGEAIQKHCADQMEVQQFAACQSEAGLGNTFSTYDPFVLRIDDVDEVSSQKNAKPITSSRSTTVPNEPSTSSGGDVFRSSVDVLHEGQDASLDETRDEAQSVIDDGMESISVTVTSDLPKRSSKKNGNANNFAHARTSSATGGRPRRKSSISKERGKANAKSQPPGKVQTLCNLFEKQSSLPPETTRTRQSCSSAESTLSCLSTARRERGWSCTCPYDGCGRLIILAHLESHLMSCHCE